MELSQQRPFGNQAAGGGGGGGGGRKPTQDFLSLYGHSTIQQDPPNPPSQGGHLKTHDFLRPLERVGKTVAKEETDEISIVEKSLPLPVPAAAPPTSVEHILPGGIGTYSISHISYFNHIVPKPEGTMFSAAQAGNPDNKNEESSNCGSYACGSGFTPWEESALKKGKARKEHAGERSNTVSVREAAAKTGWTASDRPSQSSSSNHPNCFSSLSSPQPSVLKSQSFMEMIKSAKGSTHDDDLDEEEEIVLKNESPSPVHRGESRLKVDGKSTDQKANTPRSKHSATEQRRRSKINDRFQTLRELIPHSDQKRDKASFLLEVIKHIEFLQEKVQKYEGSYQGWNQEPVKLKKNSRSEESYVGQSQGISSGAGHALLFSRTVDEKNIAISPTIPGAAQNPVECDMSPAATFKAMDQHPGITNRAMLFPTSNIPNFFCPSRTGGAIVQCEHRMAFDAKNMTNQPQLQSCPTRPCAATRVPVATDKPKEQERTIEGGTISISSMYSQGLLNTLTQALQSSGVDLSQASISVQIELGKQVSSSLVARRSILKENEVPSNYQKTTHSRISSGEESDPAQKKLKTVTS